jgi:hypothetical protein
MLSDRLYGMGDGVLEERKAARLAIVAAPKSGMTEMPHYYFDLTDDKVIHDLKGQKLANLDEARERAVAMARELTKTQSTLLQEPLSAWSISVKDEKFSKVLSVSISEAGQP